MPGQDKTGPQGRGPQTGRGLGNCMNKNSGGQLAGFGNGPMGRGAGRRQGVCRRFFQNNMQMGFGNKKGMRFGGNR